MASRKKPRRSPLGWSSDAHGLVTKEAHERAKRQVSGIEMILWVVEKEELLTEGRTVYKLILRPTGFKQYGTEGLTYNVTRSVFQSIQIGQIAKIQVAFGAQALPRVGSRKKTKKAEPVRGAKSLFRNRQKTGFELQ